MGFPHRLRHVGLGAIFVVGSITTAILAAGPAGAVAHSHGSSRTNTVRPAILDGTWACSVPAGYTYDAVSNQLGVCNPTGFAYSYRLRIPRDNIWVCSVPTYTYDAVSNQLSVCNPSGFAYSYHMRVPVNGLWACTIPPGFTYSATSNQLSVCNPNGFALSYRLVG
jgi:hypothetical protein